jgi:hypothetical protein
MLRDDLRGQWRLFDPTTDADPTRNAKPERHFHAG